MSSKLQMQRILDQDQKLDMTIEKLKMKMENTTDEERTKAVQQSQLMFEEIESQRVSDQWCVVIDMDMYYAAIEQRENPSLAKEPFIVGSYKMTSTANYEARKYGVRSAMPGYIAKALVAKQGGKLLFIEPRIPLYTNEAKRINRILSKYGPHNSRSLDEVYVNITDKVRKLTRDIGSEEEAALTIVSNMRREVFEVTQLTASAGCGPNFLLAKLAADMDKPNGQYITPRSREGVMDFMGNKPVRDIPGVGKVTEKTLNALGFMKVSDIVASKDKIILAFGKSKKSENLIRASLGVADVLYKNKAAQTSGKEASFHPTKNRVILTKKLRECISLALTTVEKGKPLYGVHFGVKREDLQLSTKLIRSSKPLTFDFILEEAETILDSFAGVKIRLLAVRFDLEARPKEMQSAKKVTKSAKNGDSKKKGVGLKK
eukprot:TRINITY_DN7428_c6_g1_i1.p1 TRINITY_DN7428_c6_g1~~TRINITY_DN7428_c6_g1_i1.p1  ORF type:complete len:498 (+),score=69.33 TRINITY_DN7428_c6_g1_i1:204-1496(+)